MVNDKTVITTITLQFTVHAPFILATYT